MVNERSEDVREMWSPGHASEKEKLKSKSKVKLGNWEIKDVREMWTLGHCK